LGYGTEVMAPAAIPSSVQYGQEWQSRQETLLSAHRRVLLVEDEVLVAALAADTLEELGYRAVEANSIKAALQIVSDGEDIAFAVVDVGLPDGRGDGLAAQLLEARAGMPVIIATGYGEAHLDAKLRANPRIAILSKPYDMAQLQAAIAAVHPSG
jgi:DNA-binding NtrC family response regulator